MVKRLTVSLVLVLGLLGFATAQSAKPLAELAPADSVLSLGWTFNGGVYDTMDDDFAALGWEAAQPVIDKVLAFLAETDGDFADLSRMLELSQMQADGSNEMLNELIDFCPAFEGVMSEFEAFEGKKVPFDALLTVSVSAFSPVPSATGLLRLGGAYDGVMVQTRETLLGCLADSGDAEITELDQDGVTLYVIGNASDFPVVVGNLDDLFFFGTNPEAVRAVVRLAQGADEPSLADTALYQQGAARFTNSDNDVDMTLNLAALADTLEGFTGFIIDGPETDYLANRGLNVLRTLGGYVGRATVTPEGIATEGAFAINPEGGDPALAEYILCDSCKAAAPFLAPESANAISGMYIPWRDLYAYAETWTNELSDITGEDIDLKAVLRDEIGFDLDVALFDWLGSDIQTYVLEPYSTDLGDLIYGQARVTVVPVSSPEAAQTGFDQWGALYGQLMQMTDGDLGDEIAQEFGLFGGSLDGAFALREYDYNGTTINRLQYSFSGDIGYTFIGNYLVMATPAKALERIIDTFEGGASAFTNSTIQGLRSADGVVTTYSYGNTGANLQGLTDLLELVSQPAAFGTSMGLNAALEDYLYWNDYDYNYDDYGFDDEIYYADITGIEAQGLTATDGTETGTLEETDVDNIGYYSDYFELAGLNPGDEVTVFVSSDEFDTYISLIDGDTAAYLDENDENADYTGSEITFIVEAGVRYWLEVGSYGGNETGTYTIDTTATPGMAPVEDMMTEEATEEGMTEEGMSEDVVSEEDLVEENLLSAEDLPKFAELLEVFDLFPATMQVITDHVGDSEGYSVIDGNTVYTYSFTNIRW